MQITTVKRRRQTVRKQDCLLPFSIVWIQLCLNMMGNFYMNVLRLSTEDNNRIRKSSSRREERWAKCGNHLGWVRVHDNQMEDLQDVVSINWQNCCAEWHPSSLAALMKSELTIWIMITPSKHRGCMANHVCSLGDTPIIRLPAVSKLRVALQYSNKNEQKGDLTKESTFNRCKTRYDLQGTRCQIKNTYDVWQWTLNIVETSFFLPLVCPKGSENVAFFPPQVFKMLIYLWSREVSCFQTLLSVHVCGALPADGSRCSVGVLRLIMDWVCGTHLTLKAYQLHSGWQPPYPQSIIPTKRRSSCWGNRALSVLLKGPFNITSCEWIALNCLTQHNTPILFLV